MDAVDARDLLNVMNSYIQASEELAVILADRNIGHDSVKAETAQNQLEYSYKLFQKEFRRVVHLTPVFHPSEPSVRRESMLPHGPGGGESRVVWTEPYWTVEYIDISKAMAQESP